MFNNIIYFIIVLLVFNISYPDNNHGNSLTYCIAMMFICWSVFLFLCRLSFRRLVSRFGNNTEGKLVSGYHNLIFRFSIFAILLFSLDVYVFQLKYWIQAIPAVRPLSVLQGLLSLSLFLFYLATIWYFSHPAYVMLFGTGIKRRSFVISKLKLNFPILFPWLILTLVYDLILMSPWSGVEGFFVRTEGQIIFFSIFLIILMIFMPPLIQYWWGCRPFEQSHRIDELKKFLRRIGFRYRDLMRWPVLEGLMMTAGIMGIIPRYRYILMTDSLEKILSVEELKAVIAHEVGHAKYGHMFFYVIFFLGYVALSFGSFDIFFDFLATNPFVAGLLRKTGSQATSLFYLFLSIPIILSMFVYFRFLMGFFMRNFERQADTFSAVTMGGPAPTISALEKIAVFTGKSRNLPSWHHFSIKERVDYLWRLLKDPGLVNRHKRFIYMSFGVYLICTMGLGYYLNFSPMKQTLKYRLISNALQERLSDDPDNIMLLSNLAMLYHEGERYGEAIEIYEQVLELDREQPLALNNLAWLLLTVPDEGLREPERALLLAKEAVGLERSPVILDTLAEAYYVNGSIQKAIDTINEAIFLQKEGKEYYQKQLKRFEKAKGSGLHS
jgi:Zn-dependent protease with chaperone function